MLKAEAKIVVVTRQTRMEKLRGKFATPGQAKFLMSRARELEFQAERERGESIDLEGVFKELKDEGDVYLGAVSTAQRSLTIGDLGMPVQTIDRQYLPNFVFGPQDIVVTLGQDGLVANVAKYVKDLPIIAVNPDPDKIDGVLLPFRLDELRDVVVSVVRNRAKFRQVTLAEARLTDGQRILAFNDLFIGVRSHTSARYHITHGKATETQSSSGVIVSTGAGSSGWLSSIVNMVRGVSRSLSAEPPPENSMRLRWEDNALMYVVREPFISKTSTADMVAGTIAAGQELMIESLMASDGVIFSDGVEADFLEFNSGSIARIRTAAHKVTLVTP